MDPVTEAFVALSALRGRDVSVVSVGARRADADGIVHRLNDLGWNALMLEPAPAAVRGLIAARDMQGAVTIDRTPRSRLARKLRRVPAVDLRAKLAWHKVSRIDLLHLDVDGREWEMLRAFDLAALRPTVMMIRVGALSKADRLALEGWLRESGYAIQTDGTLDIARDHRIHWKEQPTRASEPTPQPVAGAAETTFVTAVYHMDRDVEPRGRAEGMGPYLLSLASMAKMGAPFVVYTRPQHVEILQRFAREEELRWEVVGRELGDRPIALARPILLGEAAQRNPFHSTRLYWIDAGLSDRRHFPDRFLGEDGFDCSLFTPAIVRSLSMPTALVALEGPGPEGEGRQVSGVLFGGFRDAVVAFAARYEEFLVRARVTGVAGPVQSHLTAIVAEGTLSCTLVPYSSAHHEPQTSTPAGARNPLYRCFERWTTEIGAPAVLSGSSVDVTVILNTFKRPHSLRLQHEAILRQTCRPAELCIWQNHPTAGFTAAIDPDAFDPAVLANCRTVTSRNTNFGVWARFAFALTARTKYVCIFDDDTIPGSRWIENCLETIQTHRGLLGAIGIVQDGPGLYERHRVGWSDPNPVVQQVDYVGHAWFFEREWLSTFWRELPDLDLNALPGEPLALCAGEDMHFSYTLQKYLGLGTYVPPHPMDDRSLWGSDPSYAIRLGTEGVALSNMPGQISPFDRAWERYRARGFRCLYEG